MTIEKGLIGKEDIHFGSTGTFKRKDNSGSLINITKVNASHLPIVDSAGNFVGTTVENALAECQVQNSIGSNAKDYTNKSGAERSLGDVVVVDTDNDDSYKTTTTEGDVSVLGVVGETTANNASGKIITGGYISAVTVDGATSRGNFLKASSTAGKATPSTGFVVGSFAIAMSAVGGPGTVSAFLFGSIGGSYVPLAGGTMTGTLELAKGADVASAGALTVGSDGNYFDVIGTTTITSITTVGVGTIITLHFDDALTLTHHATDLVLPGGVNITTAAGDEITLVEYSTGDWRCIGYTPYVGRTGTGAYVRKSSPTIITPTVASFTNANHDHVDSAGGGVLDTGALAAGAVTPSKLDYANETTQQIFALDTERSYTAGVRATDVSLKKQRLYTGGLYSISFDVYDTSDDPCEAVVYVNGVETGTRRSSTASYQTYTEDIFVGENEEVELRVNINSGSGSDVVYVRNFRGSLRFLESATTEDTSK